MAWPGQGMLDFENRCEPAPLQRREVWRLATTGSLTTLRLCDEGKTGSFLEGSDLNEDVTASKLLSNDYIIATSNFHLIHLCRVVWGYSCRCSWHSQPGTLAEGTQTINFGPENPVGDLMVGRRRRGVTSKRDDAEVGGPGCEWSC